MFMAFIFNGKTGDVKADDYGCFKVTPFWLLSQVT